MWARYFSTRPTASPEAMSVSQWIRQLHRWLAIATASLLFGLMHFLATPQYVPALVAMKPDQPQPGPTSRAAVSM